MRYIGDGVYVEWNGFQVVLKANDSVNPSDTIYLEESVMEELIDYYKTVVKERDDGLSEV